MTRNWSPFGAETLNPVRDYIVKTRSGETEIQPFEA